ncbi:MAG: KamA family radical SAM protein [Desulfobulbaceae bacterium]|nr:KamA family radical SAM protein [Desulfobulbaceae bacterium]
MNRWQKILAESITDPADLPQRFRLEHQALRQVTETYPLRLNHYYLGLIKEADDPLGRQAIPNPAELTDLVCPADPLAEENLSPVPNLVHKYPDRALFLVNSACAMYCRFCTRKRKVGTGRFHIDATTLAAGLRYLEETPAIRDVLVSGGDPLLLDDDRLEWILSGLRRIPSVEIIRIGTRVPCTLPMRVTTGLTRMLKKFHPLYINTHFNHPDEITPQSAQACARLADAGIPLGCQTVLLKGVNDDPQVLKNLLHQLLMIRVKPYYLFQTDLSRGTDHFRTPLTRGLAILRELHGHTSGLAIPRFALDLPGGGGKIQLLPDYAGPAGKLHTFRNFRGEYCSYPDPE